MKKHSFYKKVRRGGRAGLENFGDRAKKIRGPVSYFFSIQTFSVNKFSVTFTFYIYSK